MLLYFVAFAWALTAFALHDFVERAHVASERRPANNSAVLSALTVRQPR